MNRRAWCSVLVAGLAVGSVHCARAPEEAASSDVTSSARGGLEGTSWRLVEFLGGDGTTLRPAEGAEYTISFQPGGNLLAKVDCNRGRATWTSSGASELELGPLALTRAMCPPGSLHDQIVKHWPYVRSYLMKDGHLFLSLMADGGTYEFEPIEVERRRAGASQDGAESLENTYWKLVHLPDAPVNVVDQQPEPHIVFNPATGRATGSGGCNRVSGSYELSGERLKLGPMIGTMMACAEGMETERAFMSALDRASEWSITGKRLELRDESGEPVARFEARHME